MFSLLIWLVFFVAAMGIVWWLLSQVPIPAPMRIVVNVVFGLIALMFLFYLLSSVVGSPHLGRLG